MIRFIVTFIISLTIGAFAGFGLYKMIPISVILLNNKEKRFIFLKTIKIYVISLFCLRDSLGKILGFIQLIISIPAFIIFFTSQIVSGLFWILEFIFSYSIKKETEDKLEEDNE